MSMKILVRPTLILGSIFFSISWLIPNKTEPWRGFHSEFISTLGLGLIALGIVLGSQISWRSGSLVRLAAALVPIPFFQYLFGVIPFSGQAWISVVYIYACLLMLLAGGACKEEKFVQLCDFLFAAILFASLISIVLQFQQWLGVYQDGALDIWVASRSKGRPAANLGQPNHLATLLLWGLIGVWWWKWRGVFGFSTTYLLSFLFIFGIAITQSRTGAIGVFAIALSLLFWKPLQTVWGKKGTARLYAYVVIFFFVAIFWSAQKISAYLLLETAGNLSDRLTSEVRPVIWRMLMEAVFDRPLWGYGWNFVVPAQMGKAENFPSLHVVFFQSHNLFLDFLVWMGLPLGGSMIAIICIWAVRVVARVRAPCEVFACLMLLTVGIHAMFEYPLHYAYFLLPAMLMAGALDVSHIKEGKASSRVGSQIIFIIAIFVGGGAMALIAKDYLAAEASFESFQLEQAGLRATGTTKPPDLIFLNQIKEEFNSKLFLPKTGMTDLEINHAERVLEISPSTKNFVDMAVVYGLNGEQRKIEPTLNRMCKMVPKDQCYAAQKKWKRLRAEYRNLNFPHWPNENDAQKY